MEKVFIPRILIFEFNNFEFDLSDKGHYSLCSLEGAGGAPSWARSFAVGGRGVRLGCRGRGTYDIQLRV